MIKKILIGIVALFTILFGYANLRFVNPSANLEPIDVGTFQYTANSDFTVEAYKKSVKSRPEIHAISIDAEKHTIGVTYEYQNLSSDDLIKHLSQAGLLSIEKKQFASDGKPGCPVHGMLACFERVLDALRIIH